MNFALIKSWADEKGITYEDVPEGLKIGYLTLLPEAESHQERLTELFSDGDIFKSYFLGTEL